MAREKTSKKEGLSIEERLEQALVPDREQPYKLPENWVWTTISIGFDVTSSKRVHQSDWLTSGIPFYRTRELVKLSEHGFVDNDLYISEEMYETFKVDYGVPQIYDLLISGVGTIGVPYVIKNLDKLYFKDGNVIWLRNKGLFNANYIFYLYKSLFLINQISEMSAGSTVDTYTIINANKTQVPLPPLAEQQRIVDRIESLFSKLDEAKEKVQDTLNSFSNRKAAILHQAFTGELTQKWREENGVGLGSWKTFNFEDVLLSMQNGISKRNGQGEPTVVLRLADIGNDSILYSDIREIPLSEKERNSYSLQVNDVLMIRVNGSKNNVARQILVLDDFGYSFCDHLIRIKYDVTKINTKLMVYLSYTNNYRNYIADNMVSSAGQNTISRKGLANLKFNIPTLPEQAEIVRILDSIFEKEQKAKELADVIEKVDLMKKAILARAFRGELGTNDPNEESAKALLKEILENQSTELRPKNASQKPISTPKKLDKNIS